MRNARPPWIVQVLAAHRRARASDLKSSPPHLAMLVDKGDRGQERGEVAGRAQRRVLARAAGQAADGGVADLWRVARGELVAVRLC